MSHIALSLLTLKPLPKAAVALLNDFLFDYLRGEVLDASSCFITTDDRYIIVRGIEEEILYGVFIPDGSDGEFIHVSHFNDETALSNVNLLVNHPCDNHDSQRRWVLQTYYAYLEAKSRALKIDNLLM